ncbi:MAG TPA: hypothetical protein VKY59_19645 [Spirillospora sp.]|nr:hypothetical protein [Spirillospora sp.]
MPVVDLRFEDGIFFAREADYISGDDARVWARHLADYAASSPTPIVALVDAREVTAISNEARRVFALASETPNVRVAAVAVNSSNRLATQQARITALLSAVRKSHDTHFFDSLEEAQQFAREQITPPAYR